MPRAKLRLRWILTILAIAVALLLGYFWFTAPPDPVYAGKHLSEHLKIYFGGYGSPNWKPGLPVPTAALWAFQTNWIEAGEALKQIGPEAMPLLRAWLKSPPPEWRIHAADLARRFEWASPSLQFDHQLAACRAVAEFPEPCVALFPELRACLRSSNPSVRYAAVLALQKFVSSTEPRRAFLESTPLQVPELLNALEFGTPEEAFVAAALLWAGVREQVIPSPDLLFPELIRIARLGPFSDVPFAPLIRSVSFGFPPLQMRWPGQTKLNPRSYIEQTLTLIHQDWADSQLSTLALSSPADRVGAAWALGNSTHAPDKAVPLLMQDLNSTNRALIENCALALGKYGAPAHPALPLLSNLLDHPRPAIRSAASNAIRDISADLATRKTR